MSKTKQSPEKSRRFRARLRARRLRQVQFWVPETTQPDFPAVIEKQLRQVEGVREDRESPEFIHKIADWYSRVT